MPMCHGATIATATKVPSQNCRQRAVFQIRARPSRSKDMTITVGPVTEATPFNRKPNPSEAPTTYHQLGLIDSAFKYAYKARKIKKVSGTSMVPNRLRKTNSFVVKSIKLAKIPVHRLPSSSPNKGRRTSNASPDRAVVKRAPNSLG